MIKDESHFLLQGLITNKSLNKHKKISHSRLNKALNSTIITPNNYRLSTSKKQRSLMDLSIKKFKQNKIYAKKPLSISSNPIPNKKLIERTKSRGKLICDVQSKSQNQIKNAYDNIFNKFRDKEDKNLKHLQKANEFRKSKKLTGLFVNKTTQNNLILVKCNKIDQLTAKAYLTRISIPNNKNICDYFNQQKIYKLPKTNPSIQRFSVSYKLPISGCQTYSFNETYINLKERKKVLTLNTGSFLGRLKKGKNSRQKRYTDASLTYSATNTKRSFITQCNNKIVDDSPSLYGNAIHQSVWLKKIERLLSINNIKEVNHVGYYDIKLGRIRGSSKIYVFLDNQEEEHIHYFVDKICNDINLEISSIKND